MITTLKGRALFAATIAIGFSALLFQDIVLLVVFLILFVGILVELVWIRIVTSKPSRWFAAHESGSALPPTKRKLYPGQSSNIEFSFVKKAARKAKISSDLPFLRLEPSKIRAQDSLTKVKAVFKAPFAGEYSSKEMRIEVTGPFDLFGANCAIPVKMEYVVVPRVIQVALTSVKLLGKSGIGEFPINKPGIGTEFYDMRTYQAGDDIRQMNWKATARRGELIVNEFAREVRLAYYIVLEASASEYFDRDRLASAFLQIANALTMQRIRFGVIIHDGVRVTALKEIGEPPGSLEFALSHALEFANVKSEFSDLREELTAVPTSNIKSSQRILGQGGYETLSEMSGATLKNLRTIMRENSAFRTVLELTKEGNKTGEIPSIIYVTGMSNQLEPIIELGTQLKQLHNVEFTVVNPTAPWVTAQNEDEAYDRYSKFARNLRAMRLANIEYAVGDPITLVQRLFAT